MTHLPVLNAAGVYIIRRVAVAVAMVTQCDDSRVAVVTLTFSDIEFEPPFSVVKMTPDVGALTHTVFYVQLYSPSISAKWFDPRLASFSTNDAGVSREVDPTMTSR